MTTNMHKAPSVAQNPGNAGDNATAGAGCDLSTSEEDRRYAPSRVWIHQLFGSVDYRLNFTIKLPNGGYQTLDLLPPDLVILHAHCWANGQLDKSSRSQRLGETMPGSGFKNVQAREPLFCKRKLQGNKWRKRLLSLSFTPTQKPFLQHASSRKPSIGTGVHFEELGMEIDQKELRFSQPILVSNLMGSIGNSVGFAAKRVHSERRKCGNKNGSGGSYARHGLPPDHAFTNAQLLAAKNTIPSAHSLNLFCVGRHSATSQNAIAERATLTTVQPPHRRRTKLREEW